MTNPSLTQALTEQLPRMCGKQCYFHDRDNLEELSGIYTVASCPKQDPGTGKVLLYAESRQTWAKPEHIQLSVAGDDIKHVERMVLGKEDGSFVFRSGDAANIMLAIAHGNPKYTEVVATGEAMELLQQYRTKGYVCNEGCKLMTYDHWEKNHGSPYKGG